MHIERTFTNYSPRGCSFQDQLDPAYILDSADGVCFIPHKAGLHQQLNADSGTGETKLGRYEEINKFFNNYNGSLDKLSIVKRYEYLVGLEAAKNEDVAVPIDILQVAYGNYTWINEGKF